jgi:hypothetical protein
LSASERDYGRDVLAALGKGTIARASSRGTIGIFADATGNKRLNGEWWRRFLAVLEPECTEYRLIEILSASGVSLLGDRLPGYFSSDVRRLAAVAANLALFVSADCGVMHLAVAAGAPTVGIFNVTDAAEWGPYAGANTAVDARVLGPEESARRALAVLAAASGAAGGETAMPAPPIHLPEATLLLGA